MTCNCLTAKLVNSSSEKLWKIFKDINYGDVITLDIKLPSCGCTNEDCFDYGTRKVIYVKKMEMVETEPYFCEEKDDFIEEKRKPGLEFYRKNETFSEKEQNWDINLFGEEIVFRLHFNELKNTISLGHYHHDPYGRDNCDAYNENHIEKEMLNKLIENNV